MQKRRSLEEIEAEYHERMANWRSLPPEQKNYMRGVPVKETQTEFCWETQEAKNYGFSIPPTSSRFSNPPKTLSPPSDNYYPFSSAKIKHPKVDISKTLFAQYRKDARKIAEALWQKDQRDTTILKDQDIKQYYKDKNLQGNYM